MSEQAIVIGRLHTWLSLQYENSRRYEECVAESRLIQEKFSVISFQMETATLKATDSIQAGTSTIKAFEAQRDLYKEVLKSL